MQNFSKAGSYNEGGWIIESVCTKEEDGKESLAGQIAYSGKLLYIYLYAKGEYFMAELAVRFDYLYTTILAMNQALECYADRVEHLSDVKRDVDSIPDEFHYLPRASAELGTKICMLEKARDEMTELRDRLVTFGDTAYNEESGLAERLSCRGAAFWESHGILPVYETNEKRGKNILKRFWEGVCEGVDRFTDAAKEVWHTVKESVNGFLDRHPVLAQIYEIGGDIKSVFTSTVAFFKDIPTLGLIPAGWKFFKNVQNVFFDSYALFFYISGDEEEAAFWDEYHTDDLFHDLGEGANLLFGVDYMDDVMDGAYETMDKVEQVEKIAKRFLSKPAQNEQAENDHSRLNSDDQVP